MTTAEAREKLTKHGLSHEQAAGVVDVLEFWEKDRVVTRDYLDKRLAELENSLTWKLVGTGGAIVLAIIGTAVAAVNFLAAHYRP